MNRHSHRRGLPPRVALVGLVGLLVLSGPSPAETGLLDLEGAGALALQQQPQLLAQEAAVVALQESAPAAGQLPDPRLSFGLASLPLDSLRFTQEAMTQAVVGVTQAIPGGDKRRLAKARAEREAAQGRVALAATSRRIVRDAQLAWLDVYYPNAAQALVKQVENDFLRQVEWSEVAYKTGKQSQEETLAQRGMLEATRDRLADLRREEAKARAGLARWVGRAAAWPLETLAPPSPPPPLDQLVEQLEQHPELALMNEAVSVAQADVDLAREAYKPDWSVDLSYGLRGGDQPDLVSVMVAVDLPLFTKNRQDRRLAARLAEVAQMTQLRADRHRALRAELEAAHAEWLAADARIERFERDILPLAARRSESALASYGSDRASYARVLEARRAETEVRLQWLAQQVAGARAQVLVRYFMAR